MIFNLSEDTGWIDFTKEAIAICLDKDGILVHFTDTDTILIPFQLLAKGYSKYLDSVEERNLPMAIGLKIEQGLKS